MGYRNYLCKVSKEVYLEVKELTQQELCEKYPDKGDAYDYGDGMSYHFSGRDLPTYETLHELGKYCDFPIDDYKENFFTIWECQDTEFSVAKKELLLEIIEDYRKSVLTWYKGQLDESFEKLQTNYKDMIREWGGEEGWKMKPYDLKEDNKELVRSWKYEYAIFDLVRIYKDFDWENDVLIFSGW